MFFDILYNITIYPIEFIIETLFYLFNNVFQSSYAVSLFLISLSVNFLSLPLYNIAEAWQSKERAVQDKMKPMIDNIKAVYKGDQRYLLIRACQRINGYKTIYAFRGTLGLLIQIPFFIAAYNFIHNLSGLNFGNFLFIKDFSKPDALINIGNININLLPFLMTLFSLLAGFVYSKKLRIKESLPLYIVSLIFLVLLYNSPSGLLFYWTINCLFSLVKNIVIEYKLYNIFIKYKYKLLKVYNIFFISITVFIIVFLSLGRIERKGYLEFINSEKDNDINYSYKCNVLFYSKIFYNSDIFQFVGNVNKLDKYISSIEFYGMDTSRITADVVLKGTKDNIKEDIIIYYKLIPRNYIINIYVFLLLILIIINFGNIYKLISKNMDISNFYKKRNSLIIYSSLMISILSGLFIPSSLISNSPQEFSSPFILIINNLSMSLGLFLFYPLFIYFLFSDKIKNYLSLLFIFISFFVMINTFIMKGNYINITSDFTFSDVQLLKFSFIELFLTVILILILLIVVYLFLKKNVSLLVNILLIIIVTLVSISIFDMHKIIIEHNKLKIIKSYNKNDENADKKIFKLSKTGQNVFLFVLDRAISSYWLDALNMFPEYKKEFEGFIYYPNTVSPSGGTVHIGALYGGYDYPPYKLYVDSNNMNTNMMNETLLVMPLSLEKYDYKTVMLEPTYANFSWVPDLTIFEGYTNISVYNNDYIDKYALDKYLGKDKYVEDDKDYYNKAIRFSIFKMLPINLRYDFYRNKDWFLPSKAYIGFKMNSSRYPYIILNSAKYMVNIVKNGNYYNSFYNMTTHDFFHFYSDDYLPSDDPKSLNKDYLSIYKNEESVLIFNSNILALRSIIDFLKYLKENNIYDNTKIIIAADHGASVNTTVFSDKRIAVVNPLLMYKDFNSNEEFKVDTNVMTISDVPYLATKHIPNIKNVFNDNVITNDLKTNGYYIQGKIRKLTILSNISNFDNWE